MSNEAELLPCPCGKPLCEGVNDGRYHQCGGPREACQLPGCPECHAPSPDTAQLLARVAELESALRSARSELAVLASYADDPATKWPNLGLRMLAKSHAAAVKDIDAVLSEQGQSDPVEPLRHAVNDHNDCVGWCRACAARGES